jgi:hypothetical protein
MHTFNVHKDANFLTLLLLSLLLNACGTSQKEKALIPQHFDLPGYFQNEIRNLDENKSTLNKTVILEGTSETRRIPLPDWNSELNAFTNIDLNSKALRSELQVDTLYSETDLTLTYTSREESSKMKRCVIRFNEETPDSIAIVFHSTSLYGLEEKTLIYNSNKKYSVSSITNPLVGKSAAVVIEGVITGR